MANSRTERRLSSDEVMLGCRACAWDTLAVTMLEDAGVALKIKSHTGGVAPSLTTGCGGATRAFDLPGLSVQNQPIF